MVRPRPIRSATPGAWPANEPRAHEHRGRLGGTQPGTGEGERTLRHVLAFVDHATREPDWREAALFSNSTVVATAAELAEISRAVMAVLKP